MKYFSKLQTYFFFHISTDNTTFKEAPCFMLSTMYSLMLSNLTVMFYNMVMAYGIIFIFQKLFESNACERIGIETRAIN